MQHSITIKVICFSLLVSFAFSACASIASQSTEPATVPTVEPTAVPTAEPTVAATEEPTAAPTEVPVKPTEPPAKPTEKPTEVPVVPTEPPAPKYTEPPQLAAMVASGELPPIDERLPANPMVFPLVVTWTEDGRPIRKILDVNAETKAFSFRSGAKPAKFKVNPDRRVPGTFR